MEGYQALDLLRFILSFYRFWRNGRISLLDGILRYMELIRTMAWFHLDDPC